MLHIVGWQGKNNNIERNEKGRSKDSKKWSRQEEPKVGTEGRETWCMGFLSFPSLSRADALKLVTCNQGRGFHIYIYYICVACWYRGPDSNTVFFSFGKVMSDQC